MHIFLSVKQVVLDVRVRIELVSIKGGKMIVDNDFYYFHFELLYSKTGQEGSCSCSSLYALSCLAAGHGDKKTKCPVVRNFEFT